MPVFNNMLAGASGGAGAGYEIERSLRFNSGDTPRLDRTPSAAGNRRTWTWSGWVKRSNIGAWKVIFSGAGSSNNDYIAFDPSDRLTLDLANSGSGRKLTTRKFRDVSAFYHIVIAVNYTSATANDRIKIYINGVLEDTFDANAAPSQNHSGHINNNTVQRISGVPTNIDYFDGYLADVHFIDGQALAATDFGETDDNGVWQPKKFAGTYFTGVNNATGAVPIYNTTDAFGLVKGTGYQNDSFAGTTNGTGLVLAIPGDVATDVHHSINTGSSQATVTNDGVAVVTTNSRLYGSSLEFQSSNTDSLTIENSDMALGTGDLCVEFWVYNKTNKNYSAFISTRDSNGTTAGFVIAGGAGGDLYVHSNAALAGNYSGDLTLPLNQWSHVAYTRASGTHRLFLNGVAASNSTTTSRDFTYNKLRIGDNAYATDEPLNAEMQDIRVYKGVAKYTSNFTVPARTSNGFHLDFADNSSDAALGYDAAGSNNWTVNNLVTAAANPVTITHARIYCSYGGGTRGANYDVDYSDDGSSWTTAFTGNMTASGCGLITGTGVGNGSYGAHKYWRYVIGSATNIHHPNSARYVLSDGTTDYNVVVYYADNCNDQGSFANVSRILKFPGNEDNDSLVDTPTNGTQADTGAGGEVVGNYATLNPLQSNATGPLANGNLEWGGTNAGNFQTSVATIGMSSGKWYAEFTLSGGATDTTCGITELANSYALVTTGWFIGGPATSYGYYASSGNKINSGSGSSYGATYANGDTIGVAFDADNGTLTFYKNGVSQGTAFTGLTGTFAFGCSTYATTKWIANFGQRAFAYTAPSGYKALCTANLPDPTIADGSKYFDTKLYDGTGSTQALTMANSELSPDFVWIKNRNSTGHNSLFDSVRGATKILYTNLTAAENTIASSLSAFNNNGFTVVSDNDVNGSTRNYAAWVWDAGDSTVSNNDGSITSQVRANPSAGFSIVKYTYSSTATVGHGLNAQPHLIIQRPINSSGDWYVYTKALGFNKALYLNLSNALGNTSTMNSVDPTSTVFTTNNWNAGDNLAYCFAPVEGYSEMGSYIGNGSTDGVFIYTGFTPSWLLFKRHDASSDWTIYDTARDSYNASGIRLRPNLSNADHDERPTLDILSNGFKFRRNSYENGGNDQYIYMAFASHPFKTARAR